MKIIHFEVIDSTNTYAMKLLQKPTENIKGDSVLQLNETVIVADKQTNGRGRMNRVFYSPLKTGVYLSAIFAPEKKIENPAIITAGAAVAVRKSILEFFGIETKIKWVNDIYLGEKKVCGILTEGHLDFSSGIIDAAVVGIGINIIDGSFPEDLSKKAGAIFDNSECMIKSFCEKNHQNIEEIDKDEIREQFIQVLCKNLFEILENGSKSEIFEEYRVHSNLIGRKVEFCPVINKIDDNFVAEVLDITDEAKLKVKCENGEIRELDSGEISVILQ